MKEIFVFGSNLDGAHAGGSAAHAHEMLGAEWGVGQGPTGDCYAIPTVGHSYEKMELYDIEAHVRDFIEYAAAHPELSFRIVAIGCGIARYTPEEIAPMFRNAPLNCVLPPEFLTVISKRAA